MPDRLTPAPRVSPAPALHAAFALHATALGSVLLQPGVWPLALGAVLGNHLLFAAAGLWPRSRLLGPNMSVLPPTSRLRNEIAITLDDGPDPLVTPAVLDVLDAFGARASFFVVGGRIAAHRELAAEILRRGHTLENHSQRHRRDFALLGPAGIRREIDEAQQAIAAVGGQARFFRAPAGLRNPFLDLQLQRAGLRLASWTRRGFDTVSAEPATVLGRLARGLCAGDILLLHDGHAARTTNGVPVVLEVLPRLLQSLRDAALRPVTLQAALA
jgi:peptidoglycan-N-acetylglucosamine deacetylase